VPAVLGAENGSVAKGISQGTCLLMTYGTNVPAERKALLSRFIQGRQPRRNSMGFALEAQKIYQKAYFFFSLETWCLRPCRVRVAVPSAIDEGKRKRVCERDARGSAV
jgi:hypothetical protein